jgi:hypothetical protein
MVRKQQMNAQAKVPPQMGPPATKMLAAARPAKTLTLAFRVALFVWTVMRVRACHGDEHFLMSVLRAVLWSTAKLLLVQFLNTIVLWIVVVKTGKNAKADDQVQVLLKMASGLAWGVAALDIVVESAFMAWATSC